MSPALTWAPSGSPRAEQGHACTGAQLPHSLALGRSPRSPPPARLSDRRKPRRERQTHRNNAQHLLHHSKANAAKTHRPPSPATTARRHKQPRSLQTENPVPNSGVTEKRSCDATVLLLDRHKLKPKRALAAAASSVTTPELDPHRDANGERGTITQRPQTGLS